MEEINNKFRQLFPPLEPYHSDYLPVSDGHQLYYEECGNPQGKPVVFFHGGPGCGCSPSSRRFFDPSFYRIILFDQRGSGRSKPFASLENNDTPHILQDIEHLRETLRVDRWLVFGGSWGSTLALTYAIHFPDRVIGLILRGIFLGRQEDIDWIYERGGASEHFPEAFARYLAPLDPRNRDHIVPAYYRLLTSPDPRVQEEAARAWSGWEDSITTLYPREAESGDSSYMLPMARTECHFWMNHMFWDDDNYILHHTDRIASLPVHIVHGRYDMDCRPIGAYLLHQHLANSDLEFVISGHSGSDPAMCDGLIRATEDFKRLFK